MSTAKITTIGLENYLSGQSMSLFDNLLLPDGIDKDTLTGSILMRAGEFEVLYPDPYFMRDMIALWSRKHYMTFDKWIKALNISYDPLNNYDRTEEYTDIHKGDYKKSTSASASGESTRTDDLTQTNDLTTTNDLTETHDLASSNDVTTTNDRSANNSGTYDPLDKQVVDQDGTDTGTLTNTGTVSNDGTVTNTGTVTNEYSDDSNGNESGDDSWTNTHKAHLFGNIGVTTSQQMLLSELNDAATWNIYEHIADLFVTSFCLLIY